MLPPFPERRQNPFANPGKGAIPLEGVSKWKVRWWWKSIPAVTPTSHHGEPCSRIEDYGLKVSITQRSGASVSESPELTCWKFSLLYFQHLPWIGISGPKRSNHHFHIWFWLYTQRISLLRIYVLFSNGDSATMRHR